MIIYLHGFRSSPRSEKAQALIDRLREKGMESEIWCEQLPIDPAEAIRAIEHALSKAKTPPLLVGSSLGGYYATYLAEQHQLKAVLINPAAYAYRILAPHLGRHQNLYTGEWFELTQAHIETLKQLAIEPIRHPSRFWLLAETGDEVLDYREAVQKYQGAKQTILPGGNHSLTVFPDFIDAIIEAALNGSPEFEVNA
jgi:predicted esterase YcpF (UPF0227 family)